MKERKHNIVVEGVSSFISWMSNPAAGHFVFSYTMTIGNCGDSPARLLSRYWQLTDANAQIQEVRGAGVVGLQPRIMPGEEFQYSSSAVINTPVGTMQGSYYMVTDDGEEFEVAIPPFTLAMPRTLH